MSIGITANPNGLTSEQELKVVNLLTQHFIAGKREVHHGCCVGGDVQVAKWAKKIGYRLVAHPPLNASLVSNEAIEISDEVLPELEYLEQNKRIVEASSLLIALPGTPEEVVRSGTWATLRYARSRRMPRIIVLPDGKMNYDVT